MQEYMLLEDATSSPFAIFRVRNDAVGLAADDNTSLEDDNTTKRIGRQILFIERRLEINGGVAGLCLW